MAERLAAVLGENVVHEFESLCLAILCEAEARAHNPIDGAGAWIHKSQRLRCAAAELLTACGLMTCVARNSIDNVYFITELGRTAVEKIERTWTFQLQPRTDT